MDCLGSGTAAPGGTVVGFGHRCQPKSSRRKSASIQRAINDKSRQTASRTTSRTISQSRKSTELRFNSIASIFRPPWPSRRSAPAVWSRCQRCLAGPRHRGIWNGDRRLGWIRRSPGRRGPSGRMRISHFVTTNGGYHYHGLPTLLLTELGVNPDTHSPQIGWAADGFPIYALYGYRDPAGGYAHATIKRNPSTRPQRDPAVATTEPSSKIMNSSRVGELDECNGRLHQNSRIPRRNVCLFFNREMAGHSPRLSRDPRQSPRSTTALPPTSLRESD